MYIHTPLIYKTKRCNLDLRNTHNLIYYYLGHANYNCSSCNHRFFTADDLEAHLNVEHGIDTKKNYCKDCKQPIKVDQQHTCHFHFANKEKKKHVPFKCAICRKEFATKNTMKRHIEQIHEGKTYSCDQCTRTFTAPNSLKKVTSWKK